MFCPGISFDISGRLVVTGGSIYLMEKFSFGARMGAILSAAVTDSRKPLFMILRQALLRSELFPTPSMTCFVPEYLSTSTGVSLLRVAAMQSRRAFMTLLPMRGFPELT
jgi:hypothetical protein